MLKNNTAFGVKIVLGITFILLSVFVGLMGGGVSVYYYAAKLPHRIFVVTAMSRIALGIFDALPMVIPVLLTFYLLQRLLSRLAGDSQSFKRLDRNLTFYAFTGMVAASLLGLTSDMVQW